MGPIPQERNIKYHEVLTDVYPEVSFMSHDRLTGEGRTLVGSRRTVTDEVLYASRDIELEPESSYDEVQSIVRELEKRADKHAWRFGGLITKYFTPEGWKKEKQKIGK